MREQILEKTAYLEAALDDPEHYELGSFAEELRPVIDDLLGQIRELLESADNGRLLAEGIRTAIVGCPNVGKSSFLNCLLGFERAIVTQIPGTTRDTIEESFRFGDLMLRLSDTAGIRQSTDAVEQIGIDRSREAIREADLVLLITDGTRPFSEEDEALLSLCREKTVLILLNKADLGLAETAEEVSEKSGRPCFAVSAKTGEGIGAVMEKIRTMYCLSEIREKPLIITNLRHKDLLREAEGSLLCARETLNAGAPEDLLTIDLMDAYRALGRILGEEAEEDLINEIFGKFCMGK